MTRSNNVHINLQPRHPDLQLHDFCVSHEIIIIIIDRKLSKSKTKRTNDTITSDVQSYLPNSCNRLMWNEEDRHLPFFLDGKRQWKRAEWIELHRDFRTDWTDECRLEKAVENINDNWVVAQPVVFPCFPCDFLALSTWNQNNFIWKNICQPFSSLTVTLTSQQPIKQQSFYSLKT